MNTIKLKGRLEFDPDHLTGKQERQSDWKLVGMLMFPGDDHRYYEWFIKKRYGISDFTKPLRKPHITFINDGDRNVNLSKDEIQDVWKQYKAKYTGHELSVTLDLSVRTNAVYWWLNVVEEDRKELHELRKEMFLSERPYFGLHMTVATTNERSINQSRYALDEVIKKFGINGL